MKHGLFEIFDNGKLGLKADDLNRHKDVIAASGMTALGGTAITTETFDRLVELYGLAEGATPEEIEKRGCPDFLLSINEQILGRLEAGRPYAIRSSALSECGGTGIYKSEFFWPTGDRTKDLRGLWHCECIVYASEFTSDARLWRERNKALIGMAILVQEVIGFRFGDYFLPPLAGTAYTTYHGQPTVRVVVGLGTKAVNGEGIPLNDPSDSLFDNQCSQLEQEQADVLTPSGIEQINFHREEIYGELGRCRGALNKLFKRLAELRKQGGFYLEWVAYGDDLIVVQCATYKDRPSGDLSFDSSDYILLLKGDDILHSGRASCKSVVFVHDWEPQTQCALEHLNETMRDFLLIVPQQASSLLSGLYRGGESGLERKRLGFCHFSNALAVVEMQRHYQDYQRLDASLRGNSLADHSGGRGASHFAQLCERADILFIGAEFDAEPLLDLPGAMDYREDVAITLLSTAAEVVVNAVKREGNVFISKRVKKYDYALSQIQGWSDDLRSAANRLCDAHNGMANHFYAVHYAIGNDENPAEFDQFNLDMETIRDFGGMEKFIESLRVVIANGEQYVDSMEWQDLKGYLERILSHLTKT